MNLFRLVCSDIVSEYGDITIRSVVKALVNPSTRACWMVRVAAVTGGLIHAIFRNVLIFTHSIDVGKNVSIGPGLRLPHPFSIVIGDSVEIGQNVTLYQGVTLGKKGGYPKLEDDVVVFTNSVIVGDVVVGRGAVIGAAQFVDKNVESGLVYARE